MFTKIKFGVLVVFAVMSLLSCNRENTPIQAEDAMGYMPMTVGKYIVYKLDSTNYVGYNLNPVLSSHFAKDEVTSKTTDNLGRESFRVVRFIKKNLSDAWVAAATMMVTPLPKSIEVIDNNLRFIKLMNPVTSTFSWKGNSYIETQGAYSDYKYLEDWEYQYDSIRLEKKYNNLIFPETITVRQADLTSGILNNPAAYSEKNYSVEVYARNVGLVYKDFLHWVYQPQIGSTPAYRIGYGIRLTIIDKN